MHHELLFVISLLFAVSLLTLLGPKLGVAYPILLVLGGLVIAFIPGVPHVSVEPDLIFLIFLPPLLYEAAWFTSWRDFWHWRRSITMLAFGLVFFTSVVVGYAASGWIPGFTLAMGFLLGGIISPPDAVAATSVLKGIRMPKRALTILEGESLINDAASLTVFRFALAAVVTGDFAMHEALGQFFVLALGGIAIGLGVAVLVYFVHRSLPTTPSIDTALTLMTPYIMYIGAEELHCSGVMSVVAGGLFLSARSHTFLGYRSRLQAYGVWSTVIFLLNGIVFLLIGLELPEIISGLGPGELRHAILYGLGISALVIAVRFVWMYPAAHLPRLLSRRIREREPSPGWRMPTALSWAGMRGVVSLASALAIPETLPTGEPFPLRSMFLVITFVVILVTLVGQGLTLPFVVRLLDVREVDPRLSEEEQEVSVRARLIDAVVRHLTALPDRDVHSQRTLDHFRNLGESARRTLAHLRSAESNGQHADANRDRMLTLLRVQRDELARLRDEQEFDDEVLRKMETNLDLEESRLN